MLLAFAFSILYTLEHLPCDLMCVLPLQCDLSVSPHRTHRDRGDRDRGTGTGTGGPGPASATRGRSTPRPGGPAGGKSYVHLHNTRRHMQHMFNTEGHPAIGPLAFCQLPQVVPALPQLPRAPPRALRPPFRCSPVFGEFYIHRATFRSARIRARALDSTALRHK